MLKPFLRVFTYMLFAALLAELMRWEALHLDRGRQYSEFGYTEPGQSLLLAAAIVLLVARLRAVEEFRQLAVCMALLFSILLIRENDQLLEVFLPHGIWKYFAAIPLVLGAGYFWKHRAAVSAQVAEYARTASFGVMLSAFVVLAFSRIFGRTGYWEVVMAADYIRVVKNAAQEGTEFLGLGLLLIGVIEMTCFPTRIQTRRWT